MVPIPLLVLLVLAVLSPPPRAATAQDRPACDSPEAREFDFWMGEWDVLNRHRNPENPADTTWYDTGMATDRVYSILDGCAIIEHWEGYLSFAHVLGFSARAWDPEKEAWVILLNWPNANGPRFSLMEGRFQEGVGTFLRETESPDGSPVEVRFRFSDITPHGLRWDGATSRDGGRMWRGFWIMDFERRDPILDRGLFNGVTRRIAERCDHERARTFDFLIGDWDGENVVEDPMGPSKRDVRIQSWPILEGCAVMDLMVAGTDENERKTLRVRSFVPSEERWVQYSLAREKPVFVRWEGKTTPGADRILITQRTEGGAEVLERVRWYDIEVDTFRRDTAVSTDDGATWRTASRARFKRL